MTTAATTVYNGDMKISVSPVKKKAKEHGISSIRQFGRDADLPYLTARRWWQDDVTQIHVEVLARLAEFFDCEPGELIVGIPDKNT